MKWQYKVERFDRYTANGYKGVETMLNDDEHGGAGWELDRFLTLNDFEYVVFRRLAA